MGVATPRYPSGLADPLDSVVASVADVLITADATSITSTTGSTRLISRQPPTVADTTAAASRSPTHAPIYNKDINGPSMTRCRSGPQCCQFSYFVAKSSYFCTFPNYKNCLLAPGYKSSYFLPSAVGNTGGPGRRWPAAAEVHG